MAATTAPGHPAANGSGPVLDAGTKTRLVVGMEIHVQLATRTKLFSSAPNLAHPENYDAAPNTLCDPVVLGLPGVLPVINQQAIEMAMRVGLALGCQIAGQTKWDRKSYYYPDLPKNYQISQYDQPLCYDGQIDLGAAHERSATAKTVRILRAHLEEDAGKLLHEAPGGVKIGHSIVDLNRAGTPLLEIVTEPDMDCPRQVVDFAQTLRNICRYLGVSEAIMQRGQMRFEPNINVVIEQNNRVYKTPIVEIKNLNSFKALYGAVEYEYRRQVEQWRDSGTVLQPGTKSTRGWDDANQVTVLQREKEEAHDYRYFPDPDLVTIVIDNTWIERVRRDLPELPTQRYNRYVHELGLSPKDTQALIDEPKLCGFFEDILAAGVQAKPAATMILNYAAKHANERGCAIWELGVSPLQIKGIVDLVASDRIGSSAADRLFGYCCESDESAEQIAQSRRLIQVSDGAVLESFVDEVLADPKNNKIIDDITAGKDKAIGALTGQVMKLSQGRANPKLIGQIVKQKLQGT